MTKWNFEAEFFTACNCDWGCPCNFNARPNEGRCIGWDAWNITRGRFGDTVLDGARFALFYHFPGLIEEGQATAGLYIDAASTPAQRQALEAIGRGKAGGGFFELFGSTLAATWLPTKIVPIRFEMEDGVGRVSLEGIGGAESELLSYPDGSTIRPMLDLPHGIEFKQGLMTNARRWSWNHDSLVANYEGKYGAVGRVKFTEQGCER